MPRQIPHVASGRLTWRDDAGVSHTTQVGSSEWFQWLGAGTTRSFAFRGEHGTFTARREVRAGGSYWYAYRTVNRRLRKEYLGKAEGLTPALLAGVTERLPGQVESAPHAVNAGKAAQGRGASLTPAQPDPIPATKLFVPRLHADVIERPRLLATFQHALALRPLILLSAPAGAGKTTLLTAALHAIPNLVVAWVAVDDEDNDLLRFLSALVAALRRVHPAFGQTTSALLGASTGDDRRDLGAYARRVVGVLINDMIDTRMQRCVVVLDDLHRVTEPAAYLALDYLLEHLPPSLTLIVATRYDPPLALARLRARRQIAEIRLPDLRFTEAEAAALLNDRFRLGLSPDDLQRLQQRTEGWAAGLSLLATSLERITSAARRTTMINGLSRTHRYVFDYLAEEVLNGQEPAIRDFLLETAILPDLTPDACVAVSGRSDAAAILDQLYHRNLFVIALDDSDTGATYRYHDLFATFLRELLRRDASERARTLHRRAAAVAPSPERAVMHYMEAEAWDEAARLVVEIGDRLLWQGVAATVWSWTMAFPVEVRTAHPRLGLLAGIAAAAGGTLNTARTLLEETLDRFRACGDAAGQGETLIHLAACLTMLADLTHARTIVEEAFQFPLPSDGHVQLLCARARQAFHRGDQAAACNDLDAALEVVEASQDWRAAHALARGMTPDFAVLPGGMARSERFCRLLQSHLGGHASPLHAAVRLHQAFLRLWRGEWRAALDTAEQALMISDQFGGLFWVVAELDWMPPTCQALLGDVDASDAAFDALFRHLERPNMVAYAQPAMASYLFLLGRVRWQQGRDDEARGVFARMQAVEQAHEWAFSTVLRRIMQALLDIAGEDYDVAEHVLKEAVALQALQPFALLFSDARLLLASLHLRMRRPDAAQAELMPVLRYHEEQGTPGFIMWEGAPVIAPLLRLAVARDVHASFATHVLGLLGENVADAATRRMPLAIPGIGAVLTAREVEVLRLLATGATNRVLADRLVISVHTAKRHVASILQKLDATTRTEAAARARELGIA